MVSAGYNHCTLLGHISNGPGHNPGGPEKAESAAFSLAIPEPSRGGEMFQTYVRIECYGKAVGHALGLQKGDTTLVEGKLSWSKGGGPKDRAQLAVVAWRILRLAGDTPTSVDWC
jgi:hypothetical protein